MNTFSTRRMTASPTSSMSTSPISAKSSARISSPHAVVRDTRSMLNSIRWSLLLWHAGLLAVVIAGFGTASYYGVKAARYQRIDAELERGAQLLASGIRYPPPFRGPGGPGDRGGFAGPGGGGGGGPGGMGG